MLPARGARVWYHPPVPPASLRLALLAACVSLPHPGAAQSPTAPPPMPPTPAEPWQAPPRFLGAWLRGAAFFPASNALPDPRIQPAVGIGVGVRPLGFLTVEAEGGWINRDYASPGATSGRSTLSSRAATLGVRVHHEIVGLEPSAFGAVFFARSVLEVPNGTGDAEAANSIGFAGGLALDLPIGTSFSAGIDWRWVEASGTFQRLGGGKLSLGGHALGAVVRLYWP